MGIATAGIVFKTTAPIENVQVLVTRLCGESAVQIEHPNSGEFDIRDHTDVMVQFFGDACFICNINPAILYAASCGVANPRMLEV